jgi:hypothetical protein
MKATGRFGMVGLVLSCLVLSAGAQDSEPKLVPPLAPDSLGYSPCVRFGQRFG